MLAGVDGSLSRVSESMLAGVDGPLLRVSEMMLAVVNGLLFKEFLNPCWQVLMAYF